MIAAGHRPEDVWNYSPRQLTAYLFLAEKRKERERAEALAVNTLAARGDPRTIKSTLKQWGGE